MTDKHLSEKIKVSDGKRLCALCDEKFRNMKELKEHYKEYHEDIQLKHEKHVFNTDEGFEQWKREEEVRTKSSFVKNGGARKGAKNRQYTYYICNRSGIAKFKTERKRQAKKDGSVKCGITCPAFMKCTRELEEEAIKITVEYQSVHAGHEMQVDKLRLHQEDRRNLASLLEFGVSSNKIIENIQKKCHRTERLGILTNKDLYNVRQSFKLDKTVLHSDKHIERIKCNDDNFCELSPKNTTNPHKKRKHNNDNLQILTRARNMANIVEGTEYNDNLEILTNARNMTNTVERTKGNDDNLEIFTSTKSMTNTNISKCNGDNLQILTSAKNKTNTEERMKCNDNNLQLLTIAINMISKKEKAKHDNLLILTSAKNMTTEEKMKRIDKNLEILIGARKKINTEEGIAHLDELLQSCTNSLKVSKLGLSLSSDENFPSNKNIISQQQQQKKCWPSKKTETI
ncbi:putative zinc finger transcription factor protein 17 [Trichonephila clavipes]|nr:putative zinc finger transcription factor protein 17 [Trichonephila clavipes]